MMMWLIFTIAACFFLFSVAIGFGLGWFVRGAYPGKRWKSVLKTILTRSSVGVDRKLLVDMLGKKFVAELDDAFASDGSRCSDCGSVFSGPYDGILKCFQCGKEKRFGNE